MIDLLAICSIFLLAITFMLPILVGSLLQGKYFEASVGLLGFLVLGGLACWLVSSIRNSSLPKGLEDVYS
jgi:hypothetical protein